MSFVVLFPLPFSVWRVAMGTRDVRDVPLPGRRVGTGLRVAGVRVQDAEPGGMPHGSVQPHDPVLGVGT